MKAGRTYPSERFALILEPDPILYLHFFVFGYGDFETDQVGLRLFPLPPDRGRVSPAPHMVQGVGVRSIPETNSILYFHLFIFCHGHVKPDQVRLKLFKGMAV